MTADDFSVAKDGDGVVERPADGRGIFLGISDHRINPAYARGDMLQCAKIVIDKPRLEQQVLGGITDDAEFGKDHHLRAAGLGLVNKFQNLSAISADVADGGIDLGQRDLHYWILWEQACRGEMRRAKGVISL